MNWFRFAGSQQVQVPKISPGFIYLSAIAGKVSGVLQIKSDKILRQIWFQNGVPFQTASNLKSELPLNFLIKNRVVFPSAVKDYSGSMNLMSTDWKLILTALNIAQTDQPAILLNHSKQVLMSLLENEMAAIKFQPSNFELHFPVDRLWLLHFIDNIHYSLLQKALPDLAFESGIRLKHSPDQIQASYDFAPEMKGLVTTIANNTTVEEVLNATFGDKNAVWSKILVLSLLDLVQVLSQEFITKETFINALSSEDQIKRNAILDEIARMNEGNYYDWLGVTTKTSPADVKRIAAEKIERMAAQHVEKLFTKKEQALWKHYLAKLNQAKLVLGDAEKRIQYNRSVTAGTNRNNESVKQGGDSNDAIVAAQRDLYNPQLLRNLCMEYEKGSRSTELIDTLAQAYIAQKQEGEAFELLRKHFEAFPTDYRIRKRLEINFGSKGLFAVITGLLPKLKTSTHYDILSLSPNSNLEQIRKAYRELSKLYHPDKFSTLNNPKAKALANTFYKRMNQAFSVLKIPEKRKLYDGELFSAPIEVTNREGTGVPKSPSGQKFWNLAQQAYKLGDIQAALINLRLGLQNEPDCKLFSLKMNEWSKSKPH